MPRLASDSDPFADALGYAVAESICYAHIDAHGHACPDCEPEPCPKCESYTLADFDPHADAADERY